MDSDLSSTSAECYLPSPFSVKKRVNVTPTKLSLVFLLFIYKVTFKKGAKELWAHVVVPMQQRPHLIPEQEHGVGEQPPIGCVESGSLRQVPAARIKHQNVAGSTWTVTRVQCTLLERAGVGTDVRYGR